MRQISLIVDQMDQCKKFIQTDELSYLRMALILLDNTSEILMYRKIEHEFAFEDHRKSIFKYAESVEDKLLELNLTPLTSDKRRNKIHKYYDEKIKFLSNDRDLIDSATAQVLRILHRYRNETYHRDKLKRETIKPIVILFFEIACDLLVELSPSFYSLSSQDNWDSFCQRYNIESTNQLFGINFLETLRDNFKKEVNLSFSKLQEILANHLQNRLEEGIESIEFIRHGINRVDTQEDVLKKIQLFQSGRKIDYSNYEKEIQNFKPEYTLSDFDRWKNEIEDLQKCMDKFSLFSAFVVIEDDFEKIESQINTAAFELDSAIQSEIDRMRGK